MILMLMFYLYLGVGVKVYSLSGLYTKDRYVISSTVGSRFLSIAFLLGYLFYEFKIRF